MHELRKKGEFANWVGVFEKSHSLCADQNRTGADVVLVSEGSEMGSSEESEPRSNKKVGCNEEGCAWFKSDKYQVLWDKREPCFVLCCRVLDMLVGTWSSLQV